MLSNTVTKGKWAGRAPVLMLAFAVVATLLMGGLVAPRAHAAGLFVVNSTGDQADPSLDGICDFAPGTPGDQCTLRAAINEANATTEADQINFDIPGTGVHTISPQTNLPNIIHPLTINGFSQPRSSPNTLSKGTNAKLKIRLDGVGVTGTSQPIGLRFSTSDSSVSGLVINRFSGSAGGAGIAVFSGSSLVSLQQNFLGTDSTGTQDLGNASGVFDQGFGTAIGGNFPQDANLISGNDGPGVTLGRLTSNTFVAHNLIGTDKTGTKKLANLDEGVRVDGSSNNSVERNTIAFNGKDGVTIVNATGNPSNVSADVVSSNSIFSNDKLGIDLADDGPTANDSGDTDSGPNGLQNKPVLSSATKSSTTGKTTVKGKLNSHASEPYTIEFYSNPSGTKEGKKLLGNKTITTDAMGNRSFTFTTSAKIALGQAITATATRAATLDTSEFSAPRKVVSS